MMYVSQIIMLYTLNLCSAVCQLYLNKTGGKKKRKKVRIKDIAQLVQLAIGQVLNARARP